MGTTWWAVSALSWVDFALTAGQQFCLSQAYLCPALYQSLQLLRAQKVVVLKHLQS